MGTNGEYTNNGTNINRNQQPRGGRGGYRGGVSRGAGTTGGSTRNAPPPQQQYYFLPYGYYPAYDYYDTPAILPVTTTAMAPACETTDNGVGEVNDEPLRISTSLASFSHLPQTAGPGLPQQTSSIATPPPSCYAPMMMHHPPVLPHNMLNNKLSDLSIMSPPNMSMPMVQSAPINQMPMGPVMPWRQQDGSVVYAQYVPSQGYYMPPPMPGHISNQHNHLPPNCVANGVSRNTGNRLKNQRLPSHSTQSMCQIPEFIPDPTYSHYVPSGVADRTDSMPDTATSCPTVVQSQQQDQGPSNMTNGLPHHDSSYRDGSMPTPPHSATDGCFSSIQQPATPRQQNRLHHTEPVSPEPSRLLPTALVDDDEAGLSVANPYRTPMLPTSKLISANKVPIVREIRTNKLKVDQTRLTKEYFDMLTEGARQLVHNMTPHFEEQKRWGTAMTTLQEIVGRALPNIPVHRCGSTSNGLALAGADVDACVLLSDVEGKENVMETVAAAFRQADMKDIKVLTKARVPTVRMRDPATGVRINFCIQSSQSLHVSRLIAAYADVDPRFKPLATVIKHWAKRRNVNEPYFGTLSSYCYMLLLTFLLQHRGVLPCLQAIPPLPQQRSSATDTSTKNDKAATATAESTNPSRPDEYFFQDLKHLSEYWTCSNRESVGELLVAFFKYYSTEFPYVHGTASVRTGKIIAKEDKGWTKDRQHMQDASRPPGMKERFWLCVEDPFDPLTNVGRPCDKDSLFQLRGEFIRASKMLCFGTINDNPLVKICDRENSSPQYRRDRNASVSSNVSQQPAPGVVNVMPAVGIPGNFSMAPHQGIMHPPSQPITVTNRMNHHHHPPSIVICRRR
ncbi:hypothetical protein SeLEV6574_g03053 [Synchytrium endobioticum]|uniref:polynucleotide adenylyltransferase n=1 Tax=Synchytrium endobioticum TaxID=286115 RepID=A0A507D5N3_9FUNG|nr:hypothetical protein SeLEV6574_g03053 [Synchytrium endobioticum]